MGGSWHDIARESAAAEYGKQHMARYLGQQRLRWWASAAAAVLAVGWLVVAGSSAPTTTTAPHTAPPPARHPVAWGLWGDRAGIIAGVLIAAILVTLTARHWYRWHYRHRPATVLAALCVYGGIILVAARLWH